MRTSSPPHPKLMPPTSPSATCVAPTRSPLTKMSGEPKLLPSGCRQSRHVKPANPRPRLPRVEQVAVSGYPKCAPTLVASDQERRMNCIAARRGKDTMRRSWFGFVALALLHACSSRRPMTLRPVDRGGVGSGGIFGTGGGTPDGGGQVACPDGNGSGLPDQLCTSDAADIQDAGRDVPPAVDPAVDLAAQTCGDAAACGSGQACVLMGGGPVPRCLAQDDGGACGFGLVPVDSCSSYGGAAFRPGCTDPLPTPQCRGLADGCGDPCSCVCPAGTVGGGCYQGSGYTICSAP